LALSPTDHIPSVGLLSIDTGALVANWRLLKKRMLQGDPLAECAAVVKANAYGLGVSAVSQALWSAGCRFFFVSTLFEAIELRASIGNEAQIVVLGGLSHGVGNEWRHYQLIPVLFDSEHLRWWADYNRGVNEPLACVLKIDTGMHRLGLSPQEFEQLCAASDTTTWCLPLLVMSHLACADEPEHPLNNQQLAIFTEGARLAKACFPNARYSLANSSGLFLQREFAFDVGRPGIALYGGNPTPSLPNPMHAVVSLHLPIMQIKTLSVGESAGYGAAFVAQRPTRLAIVFGGYADGLLRALSQSGCAYLGGHQVSLVGRVSMDSMIFDVSDVENEVGVASAIEIIGMNQSVDELAKSAGTVAYELLTDLGRRYQRHYVHSSIDEVL
jgi:alanine racemase